MTSREAPLGPSDLSPAEIRALAHLFAEELARGWIPTEPDLRAALEVVRSSPDLPDRAP